MLDITDSAVANTLFNETRWRAIRRLLADVAIHLDHIIDDPDSTETDISAATRILKLVDHTLAAAGEWYDH